MRQMRPSKTNANGSISYEYITFAPSKPFISGKQRWVCFNSKHRSHLGYVLYYSDWRQYCFCPVEGTGLVFSAGCLADIQDFISRCPIEEVEEPSGNQESSSSTSLRDMTAEGQ